MTQTRTAGADSVRSQIEAGIAALAERIGEEIASWGPFVLDPVTVSRYWEALGFPGRSRDCGVIPLTLLALYPRRPIDVHDYSRPVEQFDNALGNPVNGGTTFLFKRPMRMDEQVRGRTSLKEAYVREGRSGPLGIVIKRTEFWGEGGTEIGSVDRITVYRGGVA